MGGEQTAQAGELKSSDISRYYELLREKEEREALERREEVYSKVPQIKEFDEKEQELP